MLKFRSKALKLALLIAGAALLLSVQGIRFSVASQNGGYIRSNKYSMNLKMRRKRSRLGSHGSHSRTSYKRRIDGQDFLDIEGQNMMIEDRGKDRNYSDRYASDKKKRDSTKRSSNENYLDNKNYWEWYEQNQN